MKNGWNLALRQADDKRVFALNEALLNEADER